MQSSVSKEVNLAFQGGGAKGFAYVGCVQALNQHNLKPKNIAGSSAGALQAVLVALGVEEEEIKKVMIVGSDSKMGHIDDIQDFIKMSTRRECFAKHHGSLRKQLEKGGTLFNWFVLPRVESLLMKTLKGYSKTMFKLQGQVQKKLVPEMLMNGELVYGQILVQMVQGFLDKYLVKHGIDDPKKRKNITMAEFKEKVGVNLILTGSDLTAQTLRIFSAKTSPDLPVKFACRISSGVPFFFPPIYWLEEWGLYLGQKIVKNKMVDGGLLLNLPTPLLQSSEHFRKMYITDDPIPYESILAFSFFQKEEQPANEKNDGADSLASSTKKKEEQKNQQREYTADEFASLPDIPEPLFDDDYLRAVNKGQDFKVIPDTTEQNKKEPEQKEVTSFADLDLPGVTMAFEVLFTMMNATQKLSRQIYEDRTTMIDVTGVGTLNFPLENVNVEQVIKSAKEATNSKLEGLI